METRDERAATVMGAARLRRPAATLSATTLLIGGALTLVVLALPFLRAAYRAPALHVMLETCNALVALLVGYLVLGRFRQNHRLQTLLLALALGTVAVANLVLTALPSAVVVGRTAELGTGSPVAVRMLGTILFVAAALTPLTARIERRRAVVVASLIGGLGLATAVLGVLRVGILQPDLASPAGTGGAQLLGAPAAVVVAQAIAAVLFAVAAARFTRQADTTGDELIRWVAAGCVLAALARVHYVVISPSLEPGHVSSGDILRLAGYGLMLVGGTREITSFWRVRTEAAVVEDRRRMARDLHDGLTQELSYIWAQSQRLASQPGDHVVTERIRAAADRAIDESRRAIAALTRSDEGPLGTALQRLGDDLARRYEVKIVVAAAQDADVDDALAEALLRITGEAVRNAVRHGAAGRIDVALTTEPLSLTVTDDGCGFPADLATSGALGGFGLTSMRERAALIGGSLGVDSSPGEGTTVRVTWS